MKKFYKILISSCVGVALCTGSVSAYLLAQPQTPQFSDLTLANIEALSKVIEEDIPPEYQFTKRVAGCGSKDMHDWVAACCPGLGVCDLRPSCSKELYCE